MRIPASEQNRRIPGLDGLRAISILFVLFGHASATMPFHSRLFARLEPYFGNAELGVLTFFVISGYLITYLLRSEWNKTNTIDLRGFYVRRILRIFPAFYAYLGVLLLLTSTGVIPIHFGYLFSAALFLWNYSHLWLGHVDPFHWYVGHFWTLSLEEQFYLLWPAALLLIGLRRGAFLAGALILLLPPLRVAIYFLFPGEREYLSIMLHTAGDALMAGCLVALLEGKPRFERLIQPLLRWYVPLLAAFFLLVLSQSLNIRYRGVYQVTVGRTLECAAILTLLLWLTRFPQSLGGRLLNARPVVHLGVLSYSLYLWQQLFLTTLNKTWTGRFPLNLIVCFIVAELSYHLVERPFLALRKRTRTVAQQATDV